MHVVKQEKEEELKLKEENNENSSKVKKDYLKHMLEEEEEIFNKEAKKINKNIEDAYNKLMRTYGVKKEGE